LRAEWEPEENGIPADDVPPESRFAVREEPALERDAEWMGLALEEARAAAAIGEVPVGAVVVRGDRVIGAGHNLTQTIHDPSAHAEMVAIRASADSIGHWRLLDCTLYVTLEPCAMCAGAIVLARIPRLVYGAHDPKAGMCGSLENLAQDPRLNHRVRMTTGVRAAESSALLRDFFRARRAAARGRTPPPAVQPDVGHPDPLDTRGPHDTVGIDYPPSAGRDRPFLQEPPFPFGDIVARPPEEAQDHVQDGDSQGK